tara:strand:- start:4130 stop:4372 length:243 start_codon:yes stop_codon:yes gene_type:complete
MQTIIIDDYLKNGILIEKEFRKIINNINWKNFENENVLIKGCSEFIIPTWAYLLITAKLVRYAKNIYYGDLKSPIMIYKS